MKILLVVCLLSSGCGVVTYSHIKNERVGPVEAEVWRNNKTQKCERRVYLDSLYFVTEVPCHD